METRPLLHPPIGAVSSRWRISEEEPIKKLLGGLPGASSSRALIIGCWVKRAVFGRQQTAKFKLPEFGRFFLCPARGRVRVAPGRWISGGPATRGILPSEEAFGRAGPPRCWEAATVAEL